MDIIFDLELEGWLHQEGRGITPKLFKLFGCGPSPGLGEINLHPQSCNEIQYFLHGQEGGTF